MTDELYRAALAYHQFPKPGKLEIKATKRLSNQRDLSLAYSPGVASPCHEIKQNPLKAADYTARSNLVAVISNGTAVLGLGDIGPLAAKPVMEGKAVLFKEFADIDVFDIEIDEKDPEKIVETIARLEPSFGGINLEDIKAPECFIIEAALKKQMNIPVFHDDQHGTAIVVCAAIINALQLVNKRIEDIKLVTAGAGAAALACLNLLIELGAKKEHIIVTDIAGVVFRGRREEMDSYKSAFAADTGHRTLEQALEGADLFLGLSAAGVLKADWLVKMADNPIIMALANPVPEILPEQAKAVRPDAILATGRSDYPNQVNNVLCFPFLFRGALDVGATRINSEMKMACVNAIAGLARQQPSDIVREAYGGDDMRFGPEYLIPKPFDRRLIEIVPFAVAKAAMRSGVAQRPLPDEAEYINKLSSFVFKTGMTMKPVFDRAADSPGRIIYAEGEEDKILQVTQQLIELNIASPILIGRQSIIDFKLKKLGLSIKAGHDFQVIDPENAAAQDRYISAFYNRVKRFGYSLKEARDDLKQQPTILAATMLMLGEAEAMICGIVGRYNRHLEYIQNIIGTQKGINRLSSLNAIVMHSATLFMADTFVQENPNAADLAEITGLAVDEVLSFGIEPKVALLSHSNFGTHNSETALKMRSALQIIREQLPELEIDGEMHADLAVSAVLREKRFPDANLKGQANLLIMPNQDAANISFNLLKALGDGIIIGPVLMGTARPAHIVTSSISVRGLLNMTALAVVRSSKEKRDAKHHGELQ